jgi:hypothetical protein
MYEDLVEFALEALVILVYAAMTAALTGLGILFELRSYAYVSSGETFLAGWIGGLGLLLLGFAILVSKDKLLASLTAS